jgi:hypothetical protein
MDTHGLVKPIHPIDVDVISPDHRTQTHKNSTALVLICSRYFHLSVCMCLYMHGSWTNTISAAIYRPAEDGGDPLLPHQN